MINLLEHKVASLLEHSWRRLILKDKKTKDKVKIWSHLYCFYKDDLPGKIGVITVDTYKKRFSAHTDLSSDIIQRALCFMPS